MGGNVPDQCAITPGTAVNFGTLANNGAAATQTNNYDIYCNTQFSLAVSSLYGRLQNTSVTSGTIGDDLLGDNSYNGSSEFFAALDYDVDGVSTTTLEPGVFTPAFGPLDPVADSLSINFNTEPLASGFLTGGTYATRSRSHSRPWACEPAGERRSRRSPPLRRIRGARAGLSPANNGVW